MRLESFDNLLKIVSRSATIADHFLLLEVKKMNKLINGDCLESLNLIDNSSVDLVLIDPPYSSGGAVCW